MPTVTATTKGQVVIPAALRKKLKIRKGTQFSVSEKDGKIILEPIAEDPVKAGRGMLDTNGRVLQVLIRDREAEASR
jgi:AbrB family looped-hinge helix DNA binding protein